MLISPLAGLLVLVLYASFASLLLLRGRQSLANRLLALAAATTALWGASLALGMQGWTDWFLAPATVAIARDASWLAVVVALLRRENAAARFWRNLATLAAILIVLNVAFALFDLRVDLGIGLVVTNATIQFAVCLMGFALLENLVRNLPSQALWSTKQLLIALAALFTFNLILLIPRFLIGSDIDALTIAQPFVYVIAFPLFVVTAVRDTSVRLHVHSSRNFVFYSSTLIFSGVLLQGIAAAAFYVRRFGGTPAIVLSIVLGFTGVVAVVVAVSSRAVRSKIRTFINENFYSYKYDYRLEWTKFIRALSQNDERHGPERVLRTLVDLLDSTGGILWVRRNGWHEFVPLVNWASGSPFGPIDENDGALAPLRDEKIPFLALDSGAEIPGLSIWRERFPTAWLAVPLRFRGELISVALLQRPRAPRRLDWEDGNLLSLIAMQLAAHLVHEQTAQALADSQQLAEFNNRVTFAVHDLKNTAGQLKLLLRNAEQFGDDPEFQVDMMETIKHAEANLEALIAKLRHNESDMPKGKPPSKRTDVAALLARLAQEKRRSRVVFVSDDYRPVYADVKGPDAFEAALRHVVANAIEASPPNGEIWLKVDESEGMVRVLVQDQGPGMSADFVAHELFRPLRTTKETGLGIGAYQAREIMRNLGGRIDVQSVPGAGTVISLLLPATEDQDDWTIA